MSATIINIIIQLIAGALGGHGAGAALKDYDLGKLGTQLRARLAAWAAGKFSPPSCQCSLGLPGMSILAHLSDKPLAGASPVQSSPS